MATSKSPGVEPHEGFAFRSMRSPSLSSDVFSNSAKSTVGHVPVPNSKPAYIAQGPAEELVSAELDRDVTVSDSALELTNKFLDQMLYNILASAKSTSFASIRKAVPKVLRPRLGQAATNAADEEMRDYLDGDNIDDYSASNGSINPSRNFDAELVWKLARLRCMVYARLGDMEEEDEEEQLEQEGLEEFVGNSQVTLTTSPALFLASVITFLGEQALCGAVQHAEKRSNHTLSQLGAEDDGPDDSLVLETADMLQLGREGPLSRLWRTWRRDARADSATSRPPLPFPMASPILGTPSSTRHSSSVPQTTVIPEEETTTASTPSSPSRIPLPREEGLVEESNTANLPEEIAGKDLVNEADPKPQMGRRPTTSLLIPGRFPTSLGSGSNLGENEKNSAQSSSPSHKRSVSAPNHENHNVDISTWQKAQTVQPEQKEKLETLVPVSYNATGEQHGADEPEQNRSTQGTEQGIPTGAATGILGGAVAAVAGAFGYETGKTSAQAADSTASPADNKSAINGTKPKTVAEELLGPSNNISPPKDAKTGASITRVSDFDRMHVPEVTSSVEQPGRDLSRDSSDPEDLALSSADDASSTHRDTSAVYRQAVNTNVPAADNTTPLIAVSRDSGIADTIRSTDTDQGFSEGLRDSGIAGTTHSRSSSAVSDSQRVMTPEESEPLMLLPATTYRQEPAGSSYVQSASSSAGAAIPSVQRSEMSGPLDSMATESAYHGVREQDPTVAEPTSESVGSVVRVPEARTLSQKRMNRRAVVHGMISTMPEDQLEEDESPEHEPSNVHEAVTVPRSGSIPEPASTLTATTVNGPPANTHITDAQGSPLHQGSSAGFPARGSSRKRPQPVQPEQQTLQPQQSFHSPTASLSQYSANNSKHSSISSQPYGFTTDANMHTPTSGQQRTAMREVASNHPRLVTNHSPSLIKEQRPGTSGSSPGGKRQNIRLRSDSEEALYDESKKKSLEILINSGETLHYTLTPESARAQEFSHQSKAKSQTQDLADFLRNTGPTDDSPRSQGTKPSKPSGLRNNPPELLPAANVTHAQHREIASPLDIIDDFPASGKTRKPIGEPRDARTEFNTTRDLADYARSTGPESVTQLPKPLVPRPGSAAGFRSSHEMMPEANATPLAAAAVAATGASRPGTSTDKPTNRLKFQARDARPSRAAESTELIDFIRQGPPRAPGEHRIDRHVAPFRRTMDSEDFDALGPIQDLAGRDSMGSAQESSATQKSVQESNNSRTGLVDNTNRPGGRLTNGTDPFVSSAPRQMAPPRTQRRARDPYEIDDLDDDDFSPAMSRPQRNNQEESLIDFLRNTGPTQDMTAKPILASVPGSNMAESKRSASGSRLRELLPSERGGSARDSMISRSPNMAREESPHLTQIGTKRDMYKPTTPTHAAHLDRNRQKPRMEGRDVSTTDSTSDLADFLRDSGPPEPPQTNNSNHLSASPKESNFLKFFARKGSVRR